MYRRCKINGKKKLGKVKGEGEFRSGNLSQRKSPHVQDDFSRMVFSLAVSRFWSRKNQWFS
jgi:hypothetical protein